MWFIHTLEYNSAIRIKKVLRHATAWTHGETLKYLCDLLSHETHFIVSLQYLRGMPEVIIINLSKSGGSSFLFNSCYLPLSHLFTFVNLKFILVTFLRPQQILK